MTTRDLILDKTRTLSNADTDVAFRMDEEAFRGFYDRTSRMLWAYLHRLTGDRAATDDLLQECYYRFLRAGATLESEQHRRHYLFRIATNLVRDGHRRRSMRATVVSRDDAGAPEPWTAGHDDVANRLDVTRAFRRLGVRERALLWLAYAQGASHQEIAAMVGVKRGSVKALLYRARRRLAALLDREDRR